MRYTILIDQVRSLEWGLNLTEAAIFSYCYGLPSWAEQIIDGNEIYYFAARQNAISEIQVVTDKPDTIYRIYKALNLKGLIVYKKISGKDCIQITDKGKAWNSENFPNKAKNSEKNPSQPGKKSEKTRKKIRKNSENIPTYKSTIEKATNEKNTIDKGGAKAPDTQKNQIVLIAENLKEVRASSDLKKLVGKNFYFLLREFFKTGGKIPFGKKMVDSLIEWLAYRYSKKKYFTLGGFNIFIGRLAQMDEDYCCRLIEDAIMNGYTGCVFNDTITKYNKSKNNGITKNSKRRGDFSEKFIKDLAERTAGL